MHNQPQLRRSVIISISLNLNNITMTIFEDLQSTHKRGCLKQTNKINKRINHFIKALIFSNLISKLRNFLRSHAHYMLEVNTFHITASLAPASIQVITQVKLYQTAMLVSARLKVNNLSGIKETRKG